MGCAFVVTEVVQTNAFHSFQTGSRRGVTRKLKIFCRSIGPSRGHLRLCSNRNQGRAALSLLREKSLTEFPGSENGFLPSPLNRRIDADVLVKREINLVPSDNGMAGQASTGFMVSRHAPSLGNRVQNEIRSLKLRSEWSFEQSPYDLVPPFTFTEDRLRKARL